MRGLMQEAKLPTTPLRMVRHSAVVPGSEVKVQLGIALLDGLGGVLMTAGAPGGVARV